MGGRESIVTKRRLNRFKDKAVENSCLRAHVVCSNVLGVGGKPVGKILLFASRLWIPFVEPQVGPPLHGDQVSEPLR